MMAILRKTFALSLLQRRHYAVLEITNCTDRYSGHDDSVYRSPPFYKPGLAPPARHALTGRKRGERQITADPCSPRHPMKSGDSRETPRFDARDDLAARQSLLPLRRALGGAPVAGHGDRDRAWHRRHHRSDQPVE